MASGRHGPVVNGVGTNQSPSRRKSAFTSMIRDVSSHESATVDTVTMVLSDTAQQGEVTIARASSLDAQTR